VDNSTAGHLRGTNRALTSATGSLLLERLAAGTRNFASGLGLVRALASSGQLGHHYLVQERHVGFYVEQVAGELS
jgi:hypothetical protein